MIKILDYSKKLGGYYSNQSTPIKDSSERGKFGSTWIKAEFENSQ